jgi:hypothetical protein
MAPNRARAIPASPPRMPAMWQGARFSAPGRIIAPARLILCSISKNSEHMVAHRQFRMGLLAVLLCGTPVLGQESAWTYQHRVDYPARRESDNLTIHGHYLYPLPASHDEGTPTLTVSCFAAKLDAIVISTGVVVDHQFGASPKIFAQTDDGQPKWDRAALALQADSKTLRFSARNRIGGTEMFFAKQYIVTVEAYGKRVVGISFEMPSDSSGLLKYCGIVKPARLAK